jgi:hypothetical protein
MAPRAHSRTRRDPANERFHRFLKGLCLCDGCSQTGCTQIKSACRLAALLDVPLTEAAQNVVPIAVTAAESVERLRNWASGRCLSADHSGIYTRHSGGSNPPGHLLNPSLN